MKGNKEKEEKPLRFQMYKCEFKFVDQELELEDGDKEKHEQSISDAQKIFQNELFNLILIKKGRNEDEPLITETESYNERVTVMVVCNRRKTSYHEVLDKVEIVHNPGCRVIVDNRENVSQIAIENSSAFDHNPDTIRDLLEEALNNNREMRRRGYAVEINAKIKADDFWNVIETECQKNNDTVKSLKFEFSVPKKAGPIDAKVELKDKLAVLTSMTASVRGSKGELSFFADDKSSLTVERTNRDLAHMVSLCSQNGYDMSVVLNNYGTYKSGDCVKAQFDIDVRKINEFRLKEPNLGYDGEPEWALIKWLDNVRERIAPYDNEKKTDRKGKKSNTKHLSGESDLSFAAENE